VLEPKRRLAVRLDAATGWDVTVRVTTQLEETLPGVDARPAGGRRMEFSCYAYRRLGTFPTTGDNHVGEYLPWAAEMIGTKGYDFAAFDRRAGQVVDRIERWGRGLEPVDLLLAEPSSEATIKSIPRHCSLRTS
jgi:hypothetical protein